MQAVFGIHPVWSIEKAVEKTVEWSKAFYLGEDTAAIMQAQIDEYIGDME